MHSGILSQTKYQLKEQTPNPNVDKMGLGERGCQEPLPEGGWCQVQIGTQNDSLGSAQTRLYRETAGREIKAHTLHVSATRLPLPLLVSKPRWPPDSFSPYSRVLAMHFKVHTSILALLNSFFT